MSLTTVAAFVQPDDTLAKLPPSVPERFRRSDFVAAAIVFLVTLGVYIATLAPNVTLLDSGELITAAAKFGVGHPPGYPLWTMSGFILCKLLPFGNLAWKMNLLDAIIGAISNAVLTLLVCHSGRWLLQRWTEPEHQEAVRRYVFYVGIFAGIVIGFSDAMWSQAVISAVHGTLNAFFVNATLLTFYLWMLRPEKTYRLLLSVFVFSLGLTNHHTLVQVIPGLLLAAALIQAAPLLWKNAKAAPIGIFFSVFTAVNLFSLSILVYISWLSADAELQAISQVMAKLVLVTTAVIAFFYLKEFRLKLFLIGAATAAALFLYGYYLLDPGEDHLERYAFSWAHPFLTGTFIHPGWLQGVVADATVRSPGAPIATRHDVDWTYIFVLFGLTATALGLLYTSSLNRRLIIGVFIVGWIGLVPYSYERFASTTHPPMNWGFASERSGFYYEVSREQYPKSLPTLIKMTFGKVIGVVPKDAQLDSTIGLPNYLPRLFKTFYYYGDNLQLNFTVPLIFLTLAILFYLRRCDAPQVNWFIFLGAAFFLLGFMLQAIAPQESFEFERNLQYKVFHLQSHCIFVLLMSYGALALIVYLHELMPEVPARTGALGFGAPALFLSLLPLWSNFDACSQANHWFGYEFGSDVMRPMDKNAVYYGGSDFGRFVPTYMAFVESQQPDRWKADSVLYPDKKGDGYPFDRRDVSVITQNALCDNYYSQYIRFQYDPRYRPTTWTPFEKWLGRDKAYPEVPVTCLSHDELLDCWDEFSRRPDVAERTRQGGPIMRPGMTDVFEVNGIIAKRIFEANKKDHTFYLEQSVPMEWTYPYLLPSGLIFKFANEPMDKLPAEAVAQDRKYWDDYARRLLADPRYKIDVDATLTFGKLAYWHADLYHNRHLDAEQEHFLRLAILLCPQLSDAVNSLAHLMVEQKRFDEAVKVIEQARLDDPRNDTYDGMLTWAKTVGLYSSREDELSAKLAKNPYDVQLNLELARVYQGEGKFPQLNDRLRTAAALTNWSHEDMAQLIRYYVDDSHNVPAAIAFLEARARIEPQSGELIYTLAAFQALAGKKDESLKNLHQAVNIGGTNAIASAQMDPRFSEMRADPRFQEILHLTNFPLAPATTTNATEKPAAPKTNTVEKPPVAKSTPEKPAKKKK